MAGSCIAVVSGKGGTGKTSLTAGVGCGLAQRGRQVLCIDCDAGLRNLDLALGLTDRALMNYSDVASGRCRLSEAAVPHPHLPALSLLTAPALCRSAPTAEEGFRRLLTEARQLYDYVLMDAPAGLGHGFRLAVCGADRCVVVTTQDASALRDAQHTVMELHAFGPGRLHLVVNRVDRRLMRQMHTTIDDAMDRAGLPLLGLVPEDRALPLSLERGRPLVLTASGGAAQAYRNIAARLDGERAPLMRIR